MEDNLIAGVVSGLTVSLFVVIFGRFWTSVITPWFEERVYKDAKIEGKWFILYPVGMSFRQEIATLKRHGHEISGKMICLNGPEEGEEYILKGSFRNMVLPLSYENADRSNTDRGSITLKSHGNGKMFSGVVSHYSAPTDTIDNVQVLWFREKEKLDEHLSTIKQKIAESTNLPNKSSQKDAKKASASA